MLLLSLMLNDSSLKSDRLVIANGSEYHYFLSVFYGEDREIDFKETIITFRNRN